METGKTRWRNRDEGPTAACEKVLNGCVKETMEKEGSRRERSVFCGKMAERGKERGQTTTDFFCLLSTENTLLLIQPLPNIRHLFSDHKVEFYGLFYLLDRMNGGGVVFTAKLNRNTREA